MKYKYMKIFHEGGKTMGIKTYSDNEEDEGIIQREYEITEVVKTPSGKLMDEPAKLEDGYYPIEYFEDIYFAAPIVVDGADIEAKVSRHCCNYIGPREEE